MAQKKSIKVLERWSFDPGSKSLGPQQGRPVKRLKGTTLGKGARMSDKDMKKQASALRDWLGTRTGGISAPRKEPGEKNQESV